MKKLLPLLLAGLVGLSTLSAQTPPTATAVPTTPVAPADPSAAIPKTGNARFFAVDSNYLDAKQLEWLDKELAASGSDWKIAYFHHPLYSSGGTHGSDSGLRERLEPLFLKYGVDVVLSGHDHFYERIKPQQGITYFVVGSGGQLAKRDIERESPISAKGFDADQAFMAAEIVGDEMYFNVISRVGQTIDSGVVTRRRVTP